MIHPVKQTIIDTLEEVEDGTIVLKYMSRSFTKEEMIQEILDGSEEGNRYIIDLLRLSRDLIARRSSRLPEYDPLDSVPLMSR